MKWMFVIALIFGATRVFALSHGQAATAQSPEILSTVMVVTQFRSGNGEGCTGVLIGETTVLTAAHCLVDESDPKSDPAQTLATASLLDQNGHINESIPSIAIYLYRHTRRELADLNKRMQQATQEMNEADTYADYRKASITNFELDGHDVAVFRLKKPFSAPHRVVKIFNGALKVGDVLHFAGFGDVTYDQGGDMVKPLQLADFKIAQIGENGFILNAAGLTKPMPGDSGGPMYVYNRNELMVAAINVDSHIIVTRYAFDHLYLGIDFNQQPGISISMAMSKFAQFLRPFLNN